MSGVILWIVIVAVVVACQSSKSKTKAAQKPGGAKPVRPTSQTGSAARTRAPQPIAAQMMPASAPEAVPAEPHLRTIQPQVHVSEHDHDHGSLEGYISTEGTDPCHEDAMP